MPKFFVHTNNMTDNIITLPPEDSFHIANVLRLKINDEIIICDGQKRDFECKIISMHKNTVCAEILYVHANEAEPQTFVTLFQSLPKGDKMDWIITKSVELGISEIVPIFTQNTVVRLSGQDKISKKIERWQKISETAAKQCGRGIIPPVRHIMTWKDSIRYPVSFEKRVIAYEKEKNNSLQAVFRNKSYRSVGIFIGSEGGFKKEEIDFALSHGVTPVSLGKRILRTETAGFVTAAIILHELEDFK